MYKSDFWAEISWRHPVWDALRFYRSLRGDKAKVAFLDELREQKSLSIEEKTIPLDDAVIELLFEYLRVEDELLSEAESALRDESEALDFCKREKLTVLKTRTKSKDHHQSSKAMIASVTGIAQRVCSKKGLTLDPDPQKRCVWLAGNSLHVTSRNLDGAVPGLANPSIVWEIKEYWGKTKGGSKMSDAVYECQLVGRELREFEEKSGKQVVHVVFLDGKEQWSCRRSDLRRFIDLTYQGLIDHLIVGRQVESDWEHVLNTAL